MGGSARGRTASGPLAPYAAEFASWLTARGYSPLTVRHRLSQLSMLSRWLEHEGLTLDQLTRERAEEFACARRDAGRVTWVSGRSAIVPLGYLREIGVVPAAAVEEVEGPVEELLAGYRRYLVRERGATERTFVRYAPDARLFLCGRLGLGGLELERLDAADVSAFLARECPRRSVAGARRQAPGGGAAFAAALSPSCRLDLGTASVGGARGR
jgi:integrase/recombinase XerD